MYTLTCNILNLHTQTIENIINIDILIIGSNHIKNLEPYRFSLFIYFLNPSSHTHMANELKYSHIRITIIVILSYTKL